MSAAEIPKAILDALDATACAHHELEPVAVALARAEINPATAAEVALQLVRAAAHDILDNRRMTTGGMRDLARACCILEAFRDRAVSGRVVDLEILGIWNELEGG